MNFKNKSGFTLLELLASLPIFALVVLGMSYMVNSYSDASIKRMQFLKCQTLANNILTLIEMEKKVKLDNSGKSGKLNLSDQNKYGNTRPDNIKAHGNGGLGYSAELKQLKEKNEYDQQLYSLTTSYGDVSVVVKTYIPDSYFE